MFLGLIVSTGCTSDNGPVDSSTGSSETNNAVGGIQTATLPAGAENRDCLESPTAPDFCDWIVAVDGFYFGDITKIDMTSNIMVEASPPYDEVKTCSTGIISPAMSITLKITDTVYGSPRPDSTITFVMGFYQLEELDPTPLLTPEGIIWTSGPGLQVGDRIGIPVHKSTIGIEFGRLGLPMFTQNLDGSVVVQKRASCDEPAPIGLAGLQLAEIQAKIATCVAGEGAQTRRVMFERYWQTNKTWTHAGVCFN